MIFPQTVNFLPMICLFSAVNSIPTSATTLSQVFRDFCLETDNFLMTLWVQSTVSFHGF